MGFTRPLSKAAFKMPKKKPIRKSAGSSDVDSSGDDEPKQAVDSEPKQAVAPVAVADVVYANPSPTRASQPVHHFAQCLGSSGRHSAQASNAAPFLFLQVNDARTQWLADGGSVVDVRPYHRMAAHYARAS